MQNSVDKKIVIRYNVKNVKGMSKTMDKINNENKKAAKHAETSVKKRKKNKILRIIVKIILVLIIAIIIMLGVLAGYIYSKLSKIDYQGEALNNVEVNEGIENTGYLNIALFGIDARSNEYDTNAGSDCILIISINRETKEVKMVSVYRDSYLSYENGKYDKITDIYRRYGVETALTTLNRNLDLDITEYVTVNFEVVVDVINAVGGIEMEITSADLKYINPYITEIINVTGTKSSKLTKTGTYTLDGVQALAYARIRYIGTDINRTERQREVLMKTFDKVKQMNLTTINSLIDTVLPEVVTSLSKTEILSLASGALQYNITGSSGFPYEWTDYQPSTIYYLAPVNLEANVVTLHEELFSEEDYQASDVVKNISDTLIKKTGIK